MSKNLKIFTGFLLSLALFFGFEVVYLIQKDSQIGQKRAFVTKVGLPDIALSTEAKYIRHRSLSDIFSIFSEDPEGVSYFVTTYAYAPSPILKNTPSVIVEAKSLGLRAKSK